MAIVAGMGTCGAHPINHPKIAENDTPAFTFTLNLNADVSLSAMGVALLEGVVDHAVLPGWLERVGGGVARMALSGSGVGSTVLP
jgi:hypothetical protein